MEWAVGIAVPVLLALGAGIGGIIMFVLRARLEEIRVAEERLSSERRKVYSDLLLPYVQLFTPSREKVEQVLPATPQKQGKKQRAEPDQQAEAMRLILSSEYRKTAFDFMLIASDEVARAYNNLMQYTYKLADAEEASSPGRSWEIMRLWGQLLLEIRRSLGNKDTELMNIDMLRFLIRDVDKLEKPEEPATED